jgi:D-threo-aldose 1-dehydrogenase
MRHVISSAGVQAASITPIGPAAKFLYGERSRVRLGFGCASLMRVPSRRGRQQLLGEAFEQGIRHFDVARMYGLGAAEGELGRFARGRREQIAIATKFGIDPAGAAGRLAALQAPARAALRRFPALRAGVRRRQGTLHRSGRYDAAAARTSLETSLRALGTDYVDVFFVHDPGSVEPAAVEELVPALESLCEAGRIRAWGFSGDPGPCIELAGAAGGRAVEQLRDDIFDPVPDLAGRGVPALTFGFLSAALPRVQDLVRRDPRRWREWSRATGLDCGDSSTLATLLLRDALDRNPRGGAIFASTRPQRIAAAVAAAEMAGAEAPDPALAQFRAQLAATSPVDGERVG